MAQDSGAPDLSKAEVDIDDLEVEVYILCKNPGNFKQTSAFLTRRGWPTQTTGNVSVAIEYIAEHRPDFVMISFSHNSPAVQRLPELITQTFNLVCIGFVEGNDAAGTQRLTNQRMRHKVSGQPSGPNFHRSIRRILQERFNIGEERPERQSGGKDPSGDDDSAHERNSSRRGDAVSANLTLENMYAADAKDGPGYMIQKGDGSGSGPVGTSQMTNVGGSGGIGQGSGDSSGFGQGGGTAQGPGGSTMSGGTAGSGPGAMIQQGVVGPGAKRKSAGSSDVVSSGKYTMGKSRRRTLKELTKNRNENAPGANLVFGHDSGNAGTSGAFPQKDTADLVGLLKKSLFGENGESALDAGGEPAGSGDFQGVLERAVYNAFAAICVDNPDMPPLNLKTVSRVGVFPVDSPGFPGYLVIGLETLPEPEQPGFLGRCEQALKSAFAAVGVQGVLEAGFWVDVPEISFLQWVESASTFNFTVSHEGSELGVAFFRSGQPLPKARGAEKGMHTIGIDHIATGHPVTFKAYLHMKRNQKFFLYLRNGRELQPEQKKRLKNGDVKELYMKSVDVENLRLFLASAFLLGSIKKPGGGRAA